MDRKIKIKSKEQVQKINELACRSPYEVWLGVDSENLDARSILGLYSLVGKEVYVVAEDDVDAQSFHKLVDLMEE